MDEIGKKQYVEEMYKEVVKSFPIKEDEIRITSSEYYGIACYCYLNVARDKKEHTIDIGDKFFRIPKKEQEACIAHEIGHHESMKDYSIPRLQRRAKWNDMYHGYKPIPFPHWEERLRQLHILVENAANNKITKTKYGKYYLEYYRNRLPKYSEIAQILIANLEKKLRSA